MKGSLKVQEAFTLLEMMLSIAVFLLLMTSAFTLVGASTELITEVSETQQEAALRQRFVESCRIAFEAMDAQSELEFHYVNDGGDQFNTYLVIVNTPGAFDFGFGERAEISHVAIASEIQSDGFIRCGIYAMTDRQWRDAIQGDFADLEAPYVELFARATRVSWRFHNAESGQWETTLDGGKNGKLIELTLRTEGALTETRSIFRHLSKE